MTIKSKFALYLGVAVVALIAVEQVGLVTAYRSQSQSSVTEKSRAETFTASGGTPRKDLPTSVSREEVHYDYPVSRFMPLVKWGTTTGTYQFEAKTSTGATTSITAEYKASTWVLGICSTREFERLASQNLRFWIDQRHGNKK